MRNNLTFAAVIVGKTIFFSVFVFSLLTAVALVSPFLLVGALSCKTKFLPY